MNDSTVSGMHDGSPGKKLGIRTSKQRQRRLARISRRVACLLAALGAAGQAYALPTPLNVAGSPTYDSTTGNGFYTATVQSTPGSGVNNSGTAVGRAHKSVSGAGKGSRAVRWDGSGTVATELGNLGLDAGGYTDAYAYAVNDAGTAVGYSQKYASGVYKGSRAVRWDGSGTTTAELGNLGTDSGGSTIGRAYAINDSGTAVGFSYKFVSGNNLGNRAVRWDGAGTVATELGNLGTDSGGITFAQAYAVNDVGTAVGQSDKFVSGVYKGSRAVRWDGSGTAATELGDLGLSGSGSTFAEAHAVNAAGMAVGRAYKYVSGFSKGERAVRWDGSGTAATELGNLGLDSGGAAQAFALAVNDAGTAVGFSKKYVSGVDKGYRAVRWDGSGTAATELGNLGLDSGGKTNSFSNAVNDAGTAVGYSEKWVGGSYAGNRAVIWLPDATAVDLNDLGVMPVPAGGSWTLTEAQAFSSDGWVAGTGTFTPTVGVAYTRAWVTQVGLGGEWTDDFSGSLNGTWGRGKQWSTGTPAMQVGNATFNQNAAYTVSLDRNELTNAVNINAGTVTLNHNGFTLTATDGVTIANGAMLKGSGTIIGDVIVQGAISPGNSPGTMPIVGNSTWAGGGSFLWEINKAVGTAGADPGWDLYDVSGILNITATTGNEFTIDLATLDLLNAAGLADAFNAASNYSWTIATADGGITGFDASDFILNLAGFANTYSGTFAITKNGNNLDLIYTASTPNFGSIPEPGTAMLGLLGMGGLMMRRRRMA